jgi:hypothetical protein
MQSLKSPTVDYKSALIPTYNTHAYKSQQKKRNEQKQYDTIQ